MCVDMTWFAKRNTVGYFISKFWKLFPRLYVMNMKFFVGKTFRTFKFISGKDYCSKPSILNIVDRISFPMFFGFVFLCGAIFMSIFKSLKRIFALFYSVIKIVFSNISYPMCATRTGTESLPIDFIGSEILFTPFTWFRFKFIGHI